MAQFCEENRVAREYIRSCFDRWHKQKHDKKKALDDDEVSFDEWIHICRVEETGENKELFRLYDAADGEVSFKLSLDDYYFLHTFDTDYLF